MMKADIKIDQDRIHVFGDIDFTSVAGLWKKSLPFLASRTNWIFDFADVKSGNSATLALLLEWIKYAKQTQKKVSFVNLPEKLLKIAEVGGVRAMIKT